MIEKAKTEAMSNVDAAWLRMEQPDNLMMVSGIMYFKNSVTREDLEQVILERFLKFRRFRQKALDSNPSLKTPLWVEDPEFDLTYHLQQETLAEPGDQIVLQKRASQLMSTPLDFSRPLWQIHILDGCDGGNALMVRIHHCIADGIALISVLLSLTGKTKEESLVLNQTISQAPARLSSSGNIFKQASQALEATGKFLQNGLFETLTHPGKLFNYAKLGAQGAVTAAKLVLKQPDPKTVFKGRLGVPKLAVWSKPLSLPDVKRIRRVTGGTVNDVLLAAMTGGLRRYMQGRGQKVDGLDFRAAVPVNLRPPEKMNELGNQFGLVFLSLPVGLEDNLDRLFELKKRMDAIKKSPEAIIALGMLKAVGMTPSDIQRTVINVFGAKTTAVMTNVPGPREPLFLAGQELDTIMFWVPQSGRVGLGVSILSYAGQVRLGVTTDKGLVPDPEKIIEGFYHEFDDFMTLVTQVEPDDQ